jgi:pseudouridine synthase
MMVVKKAGGKSNSGRVPLYRALSKLGKASREEAKSLILEGKVKVHGAVELNPNRMINPDRAHIEIFGLKAIKDEPKLILFHKPVGYITTKRDPEGRPTIYDLLPKEYFSFHPVGRLDQNTSGLLLITNSTKISHYLTNPSNHISRTYIVQVRGLVSEKEMLQMKVGIVDQEEELKFHEVSLIKGSQKESTLQVILQEGKNREIRRTFMHFGHEVTKLKRVQFGEIQLGELSSGKVREIGIDELKLPPLNL